MRTNPDSICVLRHGHYPGDTRVGKELAALIESGYTVDLLCLRRKGEPAREAIDGVTVYRLPHRHRRGSAWRYFLEYGLSFWTMSASVTRQFLKRRYACIQVNTMPDVLVFACLIPRVLGARVLLDLHEPMPELMKTINRYNGDSVSVKLLSWIEQLAIGYADAVVTVNNACKARFVERGAVPEKITVIRNVPPEQFELGLRSVCSKEFVLMTHGSIERRYGQETMIRALPLLKDRIPNLRAYIVGEGEDEERLRALSRELGCSDILVFAEFVPFEKIGEFISGATIGIVPLSRSPWGELAQPNKLFEYIHYRKPVVVSRLPAIEESFDDSCMAFFEPDNPTDLARAVVELWEDESRRQQLVCNAYKRYAQMQWATEKEKYLLKVAHLCDKRTEVPKSLGTVE